jgi:hypothetical protein
MVPHIFAKYMTKCAPVNGVIRYAPDVLILKNSLNFIKPGQQNIV